MIDLLTGPIDRVVLLAAHCDDLAIGMGATIMRLASACPALRVDVSCSPVVVPGARPKNVQRSH
ncbi:MAG: hypothetical protein ABI360_06970 [Allobranchiibius sp.]